MGISVSISQAELQRQQTSLLKKKARVHRLIGAEIKPFGSVQQQIISSKMPIKTIFQTSSYINARKDEQNSGFQDNVSNNCKKQIYFEPNENDVELQIKSKIEGMKQNIIQNTETNKIKDSHVPFTDHIRKQQQMSSQLDDPSLENRITQQLKKTSPSKGEDYSNKISSIQCSQHDIKTGDALSREEVEPIKQLKNKNIKHSLHQQNQNKQDNPNHAELNIVNFNQSQWDIPKEASISSNMHKFKTDSIAFSINKFERKNQKLMQEQKQNNVAKIDYKRNIVQIIFEGKQKKIQSSQIDFCLVRNEINQDHQNSSLTCFPN